MDIEARIVNEEVNSPLGRLYHVENTIDLGPHAEIQELRRFLQAERANREEPEVQVKQRSREESELENCATELYRLAHYLCAKVVSLERTVERLSNDEVVNVVFPTYNPEMEALQDKWVFEAVYGKVVAESIC